MIGSITSLFTKYADLDAAFAAVDSFQKAPRDRAVLVIDLKTIIRKAYSVQDDSFSDDDRRIEFSAEAINVIANYKHYLRKNGFESVSVIILYSSEECAVMQSSYPDYKKYYYDKYLRPDSPFFHMNGITKTMVSIVESVSQHVPDFRFIDTSDLDEFCYADRIIERESAEGHFVLLLSNDVCLWQTIRGTAVGIGRTKKAGILLTPENAGSSLVRNAKDPVSSAMLPFLLSMAGAHLYSLTKIPKIGYVSAEKTIRSFLYSHMLTDRFYYDFPEAAMKDKMNSETLESIRKNYQTIYPKGIELANISIIDPKLDQPHETHSTRKQFTELNDQLFRQHPLDVDFLID